MLKQRIAATFGLIVIGFMVIGGGTAVAHETRTVGPYEFVVGWAEEPTFTTLNNAVQLTLTDAKTKKPIVDLKIGQLKVEVSHGGESTTLEMEPAFVPGVFGEPGVYEASLVPGAAGEYTFHFTGKIDQTDVDEEFTSGPDTFGSPVAVDEVTFPEPQGEPKPEPESTDSLVYVSLGVSLVSLIVASAAVARSRRQ